MSFLEGVRADFVLGFVLGRFLDSRPCPRQVLGFSWQSWLKTWPRTRQEKGGLGGRSPPSKSSRKHAQSKPRSSKNHPKIFENRALTPPNRCQKALERCSKARSYPEPLLGEHHLSFLAPFFRILSRLGFQDGPMLEAKTEPKSIKHQYEKG